MSRVEPDTERSEALRQNGRRPWPLPPAPSTAPSRSERENGEPEIESWSTQFLRGPDGTTVTPAGSLAPPAWYEHPVFRPVLSPMAYGRLKRIFDVTICLVALPFVLVVLGVIALAIRIDSRGPIVFRQLRTGRGGTRFRMYKLRTMVENADELKARYAHLNELTWPDFKITDDPRITRVGRILRRTSLDELPQIFNVLRGEMSLVGPRPTSFGAETYTLWHTARLDVRPGLTGLWQVSGRSDIDFDDRLRLDIAYIRNRSFLLDLTILLRTFGAVCRRRGAA